MTTEHEPFDAQSLDAALTVKDLATSLAWYQDTIGFAVDQRHERDGVLMAVSLRAGSVRILLTRDDGARGMDRQKGEGFSLQFTTAQDIDALAARIKAHGGTLTTEPTTMPWGVRAFRLQDPDGFKLVFSGPRPR